MDKKQRQRTTGRGRPKIITRTTGPDQVKITDEDTDRIDAAEGEAARLLRQSRRMMHLTDRIRLAALPGITHVKKEAYKKLNRQTIVATKA